MTTSAIPNERPLKPAALRGYARKCPKCGQGHIFEGYLKVAHACDNCGEEFFHHRADDGPPWLTMLVVGHLMAPLLHIVFVRFRPEPWVLFAVFAVGCVALSLYLLPRLKGMMIAFQWSRRLYGFGRTG
ncbi:MAG: DUF983 domain-containing protein [Pseudomonadota bacterium]